MNRSRTGRRKPSIHMAPLIDCVLLLLVFFMLTATYVNRGIPIDLPAAAGGEPVERGATLTLTREGGIYLMGEAVSRETLRPRLAALGDPDEGGILLRADRAVPIGLVVEVIDLAGELGWEVSLVTERSAPAKE